LIVDSSAIVAICLEEPNHRIFIEKLLEAIAPKIAAPTLVELYIVIEARRDPSLTQRADSMISYLEVVPFDQELAEIARVAYRLYGKGTGHPAQLNFGDCFSYALSKRTGYPLLCAGNDFRQTDIRIA